MTTQPQRSRSQIFGDDSSKTGHDFFVYGTLHLAQNRFRTVEQGLRNAVRNYPHEFKWHKARFLAENVQFLNALFEHWPSLTYRCIVVPTSQINLAARIEARPLLRAKLIYMLLNTYSRTTLSDEPEFYVTLDKDEFDPEVQAITLSRAFIRDHGSNYSAFKVRAEHSHDHLMLQAVDLITGAVAWVWNGGLNEAPSKGHTHRHTLATMIARKARIPGHKKKGQPAVPQGDIRTLGHYTVKQTEKGFGIWLVDLTRSRKWNLPKDG